MAEAGFGYGPFGQSHCGEWWWSRHALYDLIPEIYRARDDDGLLLAYAESLRPSFDGLRHKIRDMLDLRNPARVRTQYSDVHQLRLGPEIVRRGAIEQSGVNGSVNTLREFVAPTGRFTEDDRGKELEVRKSAVPDNNRTVTITAILSPTIVQVDPVLEVDGGPLRWDLRSIIAESPGEIRVEVRSGDVSRVDPHWLLTDGEATATVVGRTHFPSAGVDHALLTDSEGADAQVDSVGRFYSPTRVLVQQDVGKFVSFSGAASEENNRALEILAVLKVGAADYRALLSLLIVHGAVTSEGTVVYSLETAVEEATIVHEVPEPSTALSVLVMPGGGITVILGTDVAGVVTSTANDVVAAVQASAAASALVTVAPLTGGTGIAGAVEQSVVRGYTPQAESGVGWAILPHGQLVLRGTQTKGFVEKEGTDATVLSSTGSVSRIEVPSGMFLADDIGRVITLRSSSLVNDGTYEILSIPAFGSGTLIDVPGELVIEGVAVSWEVRAPTLVGDDLTFVDVRATSLITRLAHDFGLEIDTQESDARQRSWVANVTQWIDKKGLAKAYDILGSISGYRVQALQMFHVSGLEATLLPSTEVFEIGDPGVGRFGSDGTLSFSPVVVFSSPTAVFTAADVGKTIRVHGAANPANDQNFTIDSFISTTEVRFSVSASAVLPDANNGALTWALVSIFTDLPPQLPRYDDFDSDRMVQLLGSANFSMDRPCWDMDMTLGTGGVGALSIDAVQSLSLESHRLWMSGDIDVVQALGVWKVTDSSADEFFLEAAPTAVGTLFVGAGSAEVKYFAISAPGTSVTVEHVVAGLSTLLSVVVAGDDIIVHVETDGAGLPVSSALEIVAAVAADTAAAELVFSTYGGDGSGTVGVLVQTALSLNGVYQTATLAARPPAMGACALDYICQIAVDCSYCPSHSILAVVEADTILDETGVSLEQTLERVLRRLVDVTPAHVTLVIRQKQAVEASLNLRAEVEGAFEYPVTVYAPLTAYFDEVTADEIPLDITIYSTVATP